MQIFEEILREPEAVILRLAFPFITFNVLKINISTSSDLWHNSERARVRRRVTDALLWPLWLPPAIENPTPNLPSLSENAGFANFRGLFCLLVIWVCVF